MTEIPARLAQRLARTAGGDAWRAALPERIGRCLGRWSLTRAGPPFEGASVSLVLPVRRSDGSDAVLKLQLPHPECEHEALALQHWGGDGAVRLLAHAPEAHALLLERCLPGTALGREPSETALAALVGLLPRLWKPAGAPFRSLADEAAQWAGSLPASWERAGRPFEHALVDRALASIDMLAGTQRESVLLHQDLHGDNVLKAGREPWLAIDPKPLAGERAFGLAPIVRSAELGRGRTQVWRRLDHLSAALGVDRERARGWAFVQTLAWAFDADRVLPGHLETARCLDDAR